LLRDVGRAAGGLKVGKRSRCLGVAQQADHAIAGSPVAEEYSHIRRAVAIEIGNLHGPRPSASIEIDFG
jgi:hypothetical protein